MVQICVLLKGKTSVFKGKLLCTADVLFVASFRFYIRHRETSNIFKGKSLSVPCLACGKGSVFKRAMLYP